MSVRPTREDILQAVFALLAPLARPTGAALALDEMIPSEDKGERPPMPYLTVKILSFGVEVGTPAALSYGAARVTVTTQATGFVYSLTVGALTISHTRLVADTNATVAAALVAAAQTASPYLYASVLTSTPTAFWLYDSLDRTIAHTGSSLTLELAAETVEMVSGARSYTAEVQGFGTETEDWLACVQMGLASRAALDAMNTAGFSARPSSVGVSSLATLLLDTSFEKRFVLELEGYYLARATPTLSAAVETLQVEAALQIEEVADTTPGDPLDFTFTLEL
jgi:hypothetical protein